MKPVPAVFRRMSFRRLSIVIVGLACLSLLSPSGAAEAGAAAQASGLFTIYNQVPGEKQLTWTTCGHNGTANGCWGSGQIGPFGHACAVSGVGDTVIVVDSDSPGPTGTASLVLYKQVLSSTAPAVNFVRRIRLDDLPASSSAKCWAAAIRNQLYVGTDQSTAYFAVNLTTGRVSSGQICLNPTDTVSSNGEYVVVKQGDCAGYFSKDGLQIVNGTFGPTFFPNAYASAPLP